VLKSTPLGVDDEKRDVQTTTPADRERAERRVLRLRPGTPEISPSEDKISENLRVDASALIRPLHAARNDGYLPAPARPSMVRSF
jgi:hypothetical protein